MKRISSRDNPTFKTLRRWSTETSARDGAGIALLEGIHLTDAFLRSGGSPRQVVVGQSALADMEVIALLGRMGEAMPVPETFVLDDALFAGLSQLAQGVALLAVVERPMRPTPSRLTRASVLLDRVQDPGNVGSIMRSAAAAGIGDIYLSRDCASGWSPKVLRAAMGAHFHLCLFEACDLHALKAATDVPWIATGPRAERSIHQVDLTHDVAWVFGHEGQGLDAALMHDVAAVSIPQPGHGESLNVAACAAVCFFEQVRQRSARCR